ncbi:SRT-39 protein, partial [Aphelenchoides avenae]
MGYGARQIVLFDRENFDRLYNCTAYNVDDVPLERRQDPILGACYILLFSFYETAHLITIPVLYQRQKTLSCYKIMLYMSFFDFTALPAVALGTRVFMFTGFVYCSHPTVFYMLGLCSA